MRFREDMIPSSETYMCIAFMTIFLACRARDWFVCVCSTHACTHTCYLCFSQGDHVSALLQLDSWEHASALLEVHAQAEDAKHAQRAAQTEVEGAFCDGADVAVLLDSSDTVLPNIDLTKALAKEKVWLRDVVHLEMSAKAAEAAVCGTRSDPVDGEIYHIDTNDTTTTAP